MSVLIKGMEMPYSCNECNIAYYDNTYETLRCPFLFGSMSIYCRERNPSCPLVDVPTPHGRLIDADKLKEYWQPDHGKVFNADYFIHTIETAKPVIEAENEEE